MSPLDSETRIAQIVDQTRVYIATRGKQGLNVPVHDALGHVFKHSLGHERLRAIFADTRGAVTYDINYFLRGLPNDKRIGFVNSWAASLVGTLVPALMRVPGEGTWSTAALIHSINEDYTGTSVPKMELKHAVPKQQEQRQLIPAIEAQNKETTDMVLKAFLEDGKRVGYFFETQENLIRLSPVRHILAVFGQFTFVPQVLETGRDFVTCLDRMKPAAARPVAQLMKGMQGLLD